MTRRSHKLTHEQVMLIRKMYEMGAGQIDLATIFGVTSGAIHQVVTFKTYKDVGAGSEPKQT